MGLFHMMTKALLKMDIFSREVKLLIKKKNGHKTYLGSLLTISIILITSYIVAVGVIAIFAKNDPQTFQTERNQNQPIEQLFLPHNFTLQTTLQNSSQYSYTDSSIYYIEAHVIRKSITKYIWLISRLNGKLQISYNSTLVPLKTCNENSYLQQPLKAYFMSYQISEYKCIDWDSINSFSLIGSNENQITQYLELQYKTCYNTSTQICKTKEQIELALQQNYLSIQLSSQYLNLQDFTKPHVPQGQNIRTSISSKILKEINILMQPISTYTDEGMVFSSVREENNLKFLDYKEMTNYDESNLIARIYVQISQVESLNYRTYQNLPNLLASVGGLWNAIYTVAMLIQLPFSIMSYNLQIINSLFNFEGQFNRNKHNKKPKQVDKLDVVLENQNDSKQLPFSGKSSSVNSRIKMENLNTSNQEKEKKSYIEIKLKYIYDKTRQFQGLNQQEKINLGKKISKTMSRVFRVISQKLKLTFMETISMIRFNRQKLKQYHYSVTKMQKTLDILYIINKLQEIDKLKMILLSKPQLQLFDYIQKPTIAEDVKTMTTSNNSDYVSILKPPKSQAQKATEACQAFNYLINKMDDPINQQLMACIDQNIVAILQMQAELQSTEKLNIQVQLEDSPSIIN